VNLILQKEVVKELIQWDCTPKMITSTLTKLGDKKVRAEIEGNYKGLTKLLGGKNASQEVAQAIIADLQ
jgi:lipid-A-disaccharide synthase